MIDRSASIGRKDYERERSFVRDWSRNFVISPSQANFLIAQFDTNVEIITDFYEGVSDVRRLIANLVLAVPISFLFS